MKQLPFWAVFFSKNEAKSGFVFYQILPRDEAFSAFFCNFPSGLARPHNKIHGEKWKKKLTLSRPWTTAPAAVRAETRVYSGQYIGYAMVRTAVNKTTRREYAAHLARVEIVFGRKR